MKKSRKATYAREDESQWYEVPRTPEVKNYSKALLGMIRRSILYKIFSFFAAGYVVAVYAKYYGISYLFESQATDAEKKAFFLACSSVLVLMIFFIVPILMAIYRGRWLRVSMKGQPPVAVQSPPQLFDYENLD